MRNKPITQFEGKHAFLSNFWKSPCQYNGKWFRNAENALQAAKCAKEEDAAAFEDPSLKPWDARAMGKLVEVRPDWNTTRIFAMHDIINSKFESSEFLQRQLLETGDDAIIHENGWYDEFWGVCNGQGENQLGIILMDVRRMLKEEQMNAGEQLVLELQEVAA